MKFASSYAKKTWGKNNPITPQRLYAMVTTDAAKVAGIENRAGKLEKDFDADLFLTPKLDKMNPFKSLIKTKPKDIVLVLVGGKPVYGNDKEMTTLAAGSSEAIKIEGVDKRIIVKDDTDANKDDLSTIRSELEKVMGEQYLAPIIEKH